MIMDRPATSPSALTFARLLGEGPLARLALEAALEQVSSAAFVVSASGTELHANRRGEAMGKGAESRRDLFVRALATLGDPDASLGALVTPLRLEGRPTYYLVIFGQETSTEDRLAQAAALWELTPKQAEVVAHLSRGLSNKEIAVQLGCAERTVETHFTAIFRKAGLDGRSALLAYLARRA